MHGEMKQLKFVLQNGSFMDMFALNIVKEEREFKATKMQHANTVRLITHQMKALNIKNVMSTSKMQMPHLQHN